MVTYANTFSKTCLSSPIHTQKSYVSGTTMSFCDNRPNAAIQKKLIQHVSCPPLINQQKVLQELVDLNTPKKQIGTGMVYQRKPNDFRSLGFLNLESHAIFFKRWIGIQNAVSQYADLQEGSINERKQKLQEILNLMYEWRKNNPPSPDQNSLVEQKRAALLQLESLIHNEWQEIFQITNQSDMLHSGNLQSQPTPAVSPDPLLTRKGSGPVKWAFFKKDNVQLWVITRNSVAPFVDNSRKPSVMDYCQIQKLPSINPALRHMPDDIFQIIRSNETLPVETKLFDCERDIIMVSTTDLITFEKTALQSKLSYTIPLLGDVLFPHLPCIEDVKQGNLGDCYLLSSIISLVKTAPEMIRDMMKDNLNGTVTVRLYDIDSINTPPTYTPRDITVNKSRPIYTTTQNPAFASGSLWVSILEKAYTAAGFIGGEPSRLPITTSSYGMIESGQEGYAIQHLTGKNTTVTSIHMPSTMTFTHDNCFPGLKANLNALSNSKTQVRIEDITPLITQYDQQFQAVSTRLGTSITAWDVIEEFKTLYPGKRGTGIYTPYQLNLFMQIRDAIKNKQLVVAGSNEKVVTKSLFQNDTIGKGLAGLHGYAVIDYAPRTFADALIDTQPFTPTLLSLKLANPWGETTNRNAGRNYSHFDQDLNQEIHPNSRLTMKAEGNNNSQFFIELSDFTKRFRHFTISESLTPLAVPVVPAAAPLPPPPSPTDPIPSTT